MFSVNNINNSYNQVHNTQLSAPVCYLNSNEDNIFIGNDEEITEKVPKINVIAHRGYSEEAPENTIPAFIAAAENGYTTVECDIEWTKDSVPVLLHDSKINRTARKSNGKHIFWPKKCSSLTFDELRQYDFGCWKGEEYKGTKIPSFFELLDCAKEYGLNVYVELKESSCFDAQKAQILVNAVKEAGLEDNITWISFNKDYLETISEIMPEARLGYLTSKKPSESTIDILKELDNGNNEVFLDIKSSKLNDESVDLIKDAGFDIETWTVNDIDKILGLYEYNITGITTDTISRNVLEECIKSI